MVGFVSPGFSQTGSKASGPRVGIWAHLSRQSFRAGESGEIIITFGPREGYHIVATPPVAVTIQGSKELILKGPPEVSVDKKNNFLSTRAPVRQGFLIPATVRPGDHVVKAIISYSYTSDAMRWTRRARQPVSLSFTLAE